MYARHLNTDVVFDLYALGTMFCLKESSNVETIPLLCTYKVTS